MILSQTASKPLLLATSFLLLISSSLSKQHDQDGLLPPFYQVPSFTTDEIQSGKQDNTLKDILTTTGLLAIRIQLPSTVSSSSSSSSSSSMGDESTPNPLQALCKCHPQKMAQIPNGDSRLLADGSTTRSTIATASRGSLPLSLPQSDITKYCGEGIHESLEEARDYVSMTSIDTFIPALDRLIQNHQADIRAPSGKRQRSHLMTTALHDKKYSTISSIFEDANHLEHFHLYSKQKSYIKTNNKANHHTHDNASHDINHEPRTAAAASSSAIDGALDWHTDGGLFLAFMPGVSCNDEDADDDSFRIIIPRTRDGKSAPATEMRAVFPKSGNGEVVVAIMLGAGAEHWLNTPDSLKLRATQHAVKMKGGDLRAWYGMMHLVPSQAIIQHTPIPRTFADMKKSSIHSVSRTFGGDNTSSENDIAIGCGNVDSTESTERSDRMHTTVTSSRRNRRLQHVGSQEDCDGSSNYFCWLNCLATPDDDQSTDSHLDQGNSLYCLDPAVLKITGNLTLAVNECADSYGHAGGVMNAACANYWYPTVDNVQSYLKAVIDKSDPNDGEMKYCYGSTAMYMQGFEWEGTTCVVFLFSSWVISTRLALFCVCIVTILLGILTELITRHRRSLLDKIVDARRRVITSAVIYAGQVTMGYAIMLIVMTYSGPLVISVILGLAVGHAIINWDVKTTVEIALEGSTPCCRYDGNKGGRSEKSEKTDEES